VSTYIRNHSNIFDFCGGIKKKRDFELVYYTSKNKTLIETNLQRVNRFYVTNNNSSIIKKYHDGRISRISAKYNLQLYNKNQSEFPNDINYSFYIKGCLDHIVEIEGIKNQQNLF